MRLVGGGGDKNEKKNLLSCFLPLYAICNILNNEGGGGGCCQNFKNVISCFFRVLYYLINQNKIHTWYDPAMVSGWALHPFSAGVTQLVRVRTQARRAAGTHVNIEHRGRLTSRAYVDPVIGRHAQVIGVTEGKVWRL